MTKKYSVAPLPFMGQKRNFVNEYRKVLKSYPEDVTIVDLFGGSGLLSQVSKEEKQKAHVIFNDYDDYKERIDNISRTNILISDIREITRDVERHKRMDKDTKNMVIQRIDKEMNTGYVDFITVSSSILFSSKYATCMNELTQEQFYNNVRLGDYDATGYLDGVSIVADDYRIVYNKYKDSNNVLFLIDPPYLCTQCNSYRMSWKLSDYLDVLTVLEGHSYIYFTSNKSSIIELCEWIGKNKLNSNPFDGSQYMEVTQHLNYNSKYTDIMIYKTVK